MPLPAIAGSVALKAFGKVGKLFGKRKKRRGPGLAQTIGGLVAARGAPGVSIRRRRGRVPSLSTSEMGKLMFLGQVLGRRSPAMTLVVMRALSGRI